MSTLIPPFAAVIAALNISLGADVGGFFLETIARELNAEVWGATRTGSRGTCLNLALLLAYLYNYGVAHCSLVYDIIRLLVQGSSCAASGSLVHAINSIPMHASHVGRSI